jgi:hypothetical protein
MTYSLLEFNIQDNDIITNDGDIEIYAFVNQHLCRFKFNPMMGEYTWVPLGFNKETPFLRKLNLCTDPEFTSRHDCVYHTLFQSYILSLNEGGHPVLIPIQNNIGSYNVINLNIETKNVWKYVVDLMELTMICADDHVFSEVRDAFQEFEEITNRYSDGNLVLFYSKDDMDRELSAKNKSEKHLTKQGEEMETKTHE